MTIKDLMTKEVATVGPQQTAREAARIMWDCDCGVLPVVDQDHRVLGMVTDRDLCMAAMHRQASLDAFTVAEAMSKVLYSCTAADSLSTAEQIMCDNQVRRLPVVDREGRLSGILSMADVVRATQLSAGPSRPVSAEDVTNTLARICAPRDGIGQTRPSV